MASKVTIEVYPAGTSVVVDPAHKNTWETDVWPDDRVAIVDSARLTARGISYLVSWAKAGKRYADVVPDSLVKAVD